MTTDSMRELMRICSEDASED